MSTQVKFENINYFLPDEIHYQKYKYNGLLKPGRKTAFIYMQRKNKKRKMGRIEDIDRCSRIRTLEQNWETFTILPVLGMQLPVKPYQSPGCASGEVVTWIAKLGQTSSQVLSGIILVCSKEQGESSIDRLWLMLVLVVRLQLDDEGYVDSLPPVEMCVKHRVAGQRVSRHRVSYCTQSRKVDWRRLIHFSASIYNINSGELGLEFGIYIGSCLKPPSNLCILHFFGGVDCTGKRTLVLQHG